ncbi:MAG: hypothetical protein AB7O28_01545 [Vicinamibacterales bacterium]
MLTAASLASILLMTFHLTDDVVRGFEPGGLKNEIGVLILAVWLYGTLAIAGRAARYVVILLGSVLGSGVPVVHMMGPGLVGGRVAGSDGTFFWVWTLLALGVTALFSVALAVRALVGLWRGGSAQDQPS